ncbi:MAG: pyridoxamine 5'-phosphate oxidase [Candidatus Thermofonsia bacterium]|nr:MAG: pyridoxamine 5'-phosphate oxidase [Candidatus Thermofonsia bacterium]
MAKFKRGQGKRPSMAAGYGIQQTEEGLLPWTWLSERMAASRSYWLATVQPTGKPHAAPIWGIWLDEQFYFGTDRHSRKGKNLAANPQAVVHLESGDEVVILEGYVEEVPDSPLHDRYTAVYEAKYHFRPGPPNETAVTYRLVPTAAFAWLESDFPNTATRWEWRS